MSLRIPEDVLAKARSEAASYGVSTHRYIIEALRAIPDVPGPPEYPRLVWPKQGRKAT